VNLLDLIIVLAAVAYGIGGFRSGAVVGIGSLLGFFGGAALGAKIARPIGSHLADGRAQIPIAIICVLLFAMGGQLLGVYGAGRLKRHIVRERIGRGVDAGVGAGLGVVSVLLVAWLVAAPLAYSPYPSLAREAGQSSIVHDVNQVLPQGLRDWFSSLREFFDRSGFPPVLGDLPSTAIVSVAAPPLNLPAAVQAQVRSAQKSVFKIYGQAPECDRGIEGSGFVFAPDRIMTNAHVVAGTRTVTVQASGGRTLTATVVVFDPNRDVAVLDVPGLNAPVLNFASKPAKTGDPAVVLGYPENGPFTVDSARVRSESTVQGSNIYGNGNIKRSIYSIRGTVRSGNSGGPLLSDDGTVLGVVFATALDSSDTGFVLTDSEVAPLATQGRTATTAVGTSGCTPND
jgi:S1-C subfamily serine protease